MSFTHWKILETFIYSIMPFIIFFVLIIGFVLIFMLLYTRKSRKIIIAFLSLIVITLAGVFAVHRIYSDEITLLGQTTPAIRHTYRKVSGYYSLPQAKPKLMDRPFLEKLDLYNEAEISEDDDITFVGNTKHLYYFMIKSTLYKINNTTPYIEFTDDVATETFVGYEYTLKDENFTELGFYDVVGPIYTKLLIPTRLKDLQFDHQGEKSNFFNFEFQDKNEGPN